MSVAKTKEAIENTPDNDELDFPTAWFALDDRRITTANLKALAASHTRLLEAAKDILEREDIKDGAAKSTASAVRYSRLYKVVNEAEK